MGVHYMFEKVTATRLFQNRLFPLLSGLNKVLMTPSSSPRAWHLKGGTCTGAARLWGIAEGTSAFPGLHFPHCWRVMQPQCDRLWKVCPGVWLPSA